MSLELDCIFRILEKEQNHIILLIVVCSSMWFILLHSTYFYKLYIYTEIEEIEMSVECLLFMLSKDVNIILLVYFFSNSIS